jgi:integrase/recombinase XerD
MVHLSKDEIKSLLREVKNPRHRLMLKVTMLHGLRVSEVINLTREDVRDNYIKVQRLKGSLKTVQPYVSSTDPELDEATELTALFGTLKPGERLFPVCRDTVNKLMLKAGTKAGIPRHKLHPHALKHSCAMITIKTTGIENVRQYLGHKTISSTGEYLRVADDEASKAVMGAFQ